MGGDSAAVSGWDTRRPRSPKVFRSGPFLYGFTSSFRMGQILEHELAPRPREKKTSARAYLCGPWIEDVRTCLKQHGYTKIDNNQETGGHFLLGYAGQIFEVYDDFQVADYAEPYATCGSGAAHALGALQVLVHMKLPDATIVRRALQVAEQFNVGVRGPFVIRRLPADAR